MTNAIERITSPGLTPAGRASQATQIEQSRAVAEVQAAVVVAQQCPRDIDKAVAQMQRSCATPALASRAFFSFPRAGETISGATIHLARDLARVWGNIQYGFAELSRDVAGGVSEMQAWAWDVETNTRSSQTFMVPHFRDTKRGQTPIVDLRDVYENNANLGSRRLREAIFSVLPPWFVEDAKELCQRTLASVTGKDLLDKIEVAVKAFGRRGITVGQLEEKVGARQADWTGDEYAQLDILWGSLKRGEITQDEAFPATRVTAAELTGGDSWPATAQPGEVTS